MKEIITALQNLKTSPWYHLGAYQQAFEAALKVLSASDASASIWSRNGAFWTQDSQTATEIENRLGWLDLPQTMALDITRLKALAMEVKAAGIERIVLLGMGGSSLAPEVMCRILGTAPGYPDLIVLDSTDPAQIRRVKDEANLSECLFLVASKSGTTAETISLLAFFRDAMVAQVGVENARTHFVVLTDPESPLEDWAHSENCRACYLNRPDIGGRYSALSLFGLVPAALIGIDLDLLLYRAREMAWACRSTLPAQDNPALVLGAIIGSLANHATQPRDKLTIITSPGFAPFYTWVEQLIAESTGKNGRGILPVDGNELPDIQVPPPDHVYIYMRMSKANNRKSDEKIAHLAQAGSPIVVLPLVDSYDLGKEFFRWEFATATVGKLLSINPFDQPDVESAKERARRALVQYKETHALPSESPVLHEGEFHIYGPQFEAGSISEYLQAFWAQSKQGDYIALMAYVERNRAHDALLQKMRCILTEALGLAVTVGFGPRFLHSTGQLHKGGANTGLFLQITQDETNDLPIPDQPHTFGILKQAQAQGDLEALRATERRVIRINIGDQPETGLGKLVAAIQESTSDRLTPSE